jgi:hypothetical protein
MWKSLRSGFIDCIAAIILVFLIILPVFVTMLEFADKNLSCQRVQSIGLNCVLEHILYEKRIWQEDIQGLERATIRTHVSTSKERVKKRDTTDSSKKDKEEYRTVTTVSYRIRLHSRNGRFHFGHEEEYKPKLKAVESQINSLINDANKSSFQFYYIQDNPVASLFYLAGAIFALSLYYLIMLPTMIQYYIESINPHTCIRSLFYRLGFDYLISRFWNQ